MAEIVRTCVNHPDTETRISCSSCGNPICTRCMRTAAVGQKCPSCARPARSSRARGKPQHYVRAIGAGLGAAVVGGVLYAQLLAAVRFGALILAGVLGYVIGRVVRWGTRGQTQPPFTGIAIGLAVAAVAVAFVVGYGSPLPVRGLAILAYPIAGWLSLRGLQQ
ncbi:MAG TPA: hypothetical protein VK875_03355 [Euzebyales bacterium]|nr:hypothetical protein [Euzebyales bacterium]